MSSPLSEQTVSERKIMKTTPEKRYLIREVAESCDWSTSDKTCIECIKNDLKRFLEPIAKALEKTQLARCVEVAQKLRRLFEKNRLALDIYHSAEDNITQAESISRRKLEMVFRPLIAILDSIKGNKVAKKYSRRLKKLLLPPPLTKEEAAKERQHMISFGRIPREKMTPAERIDYDRRLYESDKKRANFIRGMHESVMRHRYGDDWSFGS